MWKLFHSYYFLPRVLRRVKGLLYKKIVLYTRNAYLGFLVSSLESRVSWSVCCEVAAVLSPGRAAPLAGRGLRALSHTRGASPRAQLQGSH